MFSTIQQLTQRVAGIENSGFPVVEVDLFGSDVKTLGIIVDKLPDGRVIIFTPTSPLVTVGQLYIVPIERTVELNASIQDTINCLSKAGLESNKIYNKETT